MSSLDAWAATFTLRGLEPRRRRETVAAIVAVNQTSPYDVDAAIDGDDVVIAVEFAIERLVDVTDAANHVTRIARWTLGRDERGRDALKLATELAVTVTRTPGGTT